jgi:F0F1-type ATP synthase epsilon subunit
MATPSSKSFLLEIVTPSRKVFSERVSAIVAPGADGYLGVLPGHTPLFTGLRTGYLKVEQIFSRRRAMRFILPSPVVFAGFAGVAILAKPLACG